MDVVGLLRQLWRRRGLVCLGVALALVAAIFMAFRVDPGGSPLFQSRQYEVGVASASVLVDSQSSQVIDLTGGTTRADVETLSTRARLLATLLATSPLKDRIAGLAGLPPDRLLGVPPETGPTATSPAAETPLATVARVEPSMPDAHILTLYVAADVPIITLRAQAPSAPAARRIALSAVSELTRYLKSVAASNDVPDARQLVVAPLGPPVSATETRGPRRLYSLAAFLLVSTLWCAGILAVGAVVRGWRQAMASEASPGGDAVGGAPPPSDDHLHRVEVPSIPPAWSQSRLPDHDEGLREKEEAPGASCV